MISLYLRENFGTCSSEKCSCLKYGWRGTACEWWKPTPAKTYDELREWQNGLVQHRREDTKS